MSHTLGHRALAAVALAAAVVAAAVLVPGREAAGANGDPAAALEKHRVDMQTAFGRHDAAGIAALYAPDALYLSDGNDIRRGREAIEAGFARYFRVLADNGARVELSQKVVESRFDGEMAYEVGYYHLESRVEGKAPEVAEWKYCLVYSRGRDGIWRLQVESMGPVPVGAMGAAG